MRWWGVRSERPRQPGRRDGGKRDQRDLDGDIVAGEIEQSLTEARSRSAGDTTNSIFGFDLRCKERERCLRLREELGI